MRGEHLSSNHWVELYRLIGLPRTTDIAKLRVSELLGMADKIIANVAALKELNSRAQGEVSIRDALTELEVSLENTTILM